MNLIKHDLEQLETLLSWLSGTTFSKPWLPMAYIPFLDNGSVGAAILAQREGDERFYTIRAYSAHTEVEIEDRFPTLAKGLANLPEATKGKDHVFEMVRL